MLMRMRKKGDSHRKSRRLAVEHRIFRKSRRCSSLKTGSKYIFARPETAG